MGVGDVINQKGIMYDKEDIASARESFDPEGVLEKYGEFNFSDILGNMFKPRSGVNLSQSQLGGYTPTTVAEEISHGLEWEEGDIHPNFFDADFPLQDYLLRLQEETRAKLDAFGDVAKKEGIGQALLNLPHLAGTWSTYLFNPSIMGRTPSSYGEGGAGDKRYYDWLEEGITSSVLDNLLEDTSIYRDYLKEGVNYATKSDLQRYIYLTQKLGYDMPPLSELPELKNAKSEEDHAKALNAWFPEGHDIYYDIFNMQRTQEIQNAGPLETILNWTKRRTY